MKKLIYILPLLAFMATGCYQINTGDTGFKTSFGKIDSVTLDPGLYFVNPIGGDLIQYTLRDQRYDCKMFTYTKDMQQAKFEVSILVSIEKSNVIDIHTRYGSNYINIIMEPIFYSALKEVVGQWDAEKLINGREAATKAVYDRILQLAKGKPITIKGFNILNIDYMDAFEKAIEEKVVAAQEAIKAKNKTVQIEEEAKQKIIQARAEAEAIEIRAAALAKNKDIIMLNLIEKWDGKAPSTLSVGQGANLFLPTTK
jgi:regulator of protease activity HflC (stomatin/prohibitin superfamily)